MIISNLNKIIMKLKTTLLLLLITIASFSQNKEKIKGNKIVKVEQHQIAPFTTLKISENLEVQLLQGITPQIEFETDENLHDVFQFSINKKGVLSITTTHKIISKKKLKIRVTFTENFTTIIASEKAEVSSLVDFDMENLNIHAKDNTRIYITAKVTNFKLDTYNHAKVELNLTSQNATILMNKSSNLKALINSTNLKLDLYQKSNAKIEGDTEQLDLRIDNATNFKGKNFTAKNCSLITEGSSDCYIDVKKNLTLEASGTSEIHIYGNPKIKLNKFNDNAILYKKKY